MNSSDEKEITVYLVGGQADVYASKDIATASIMRSIFDDENDHWIGKLTSGEQDIVRALKDQPKLAIDAYNRFSKVENQWCISEETVRN